MTYSKKQSKANVLPKRDWSQFNGYGFIAAVVREVDPGFRKKLLQGLAAKSPFLKRICESLSFTYQDLAKVDGKSVAVLWQVVPEDRWLIAWKLTSETLRAHLIAGLSERRRADFTQRFEAQAKMPKNQVVRVQMQIAHTVLQQIESGKIRLRSKPVVRMARSSS